VLSENALSGLVFRIGKKGLERYTLYLGAGT